MPLGFHDNTLPRLPPASITVISHSLRGSSWTPSVGLALAIFSSLSDLIQPSSANDSQVLSPAWTFTLTSRPSASPLAWQLYVWLSCTRGQHKFSILLPPSIYLLHSWSVPQETWQPFTQMYRTKAQDHLCFISCSHVESHLCGLCVQNKPSISTSPTFPGAALVQLPPSLTWAITQPPHLPSCFHLCPYSLFPNCS